MLLHLAGAIDPHDREQIVARIHALHTSILALLDAGLLGTASVQKHVIELVSRGPRPVSAGAVVREFFREVRSSDALRIAKTVSSG